MARKYGKIWTSIWLDTDFRELSSDAMLLYFALSSSPTLTFSGVMTWSQRRMATLTNLGDRVVDAAAELVSARYIVIDETTDEVLVRSFIRSDEVMRQPNVAKALRDDFESVFSASIRGVIVHELNRLREDGLTNDSAWNAVSDIASQTSIDPSSNPCPYPSANPFENPSRKGSANPSRKGVEKATAEASEDDDELEMPLLSVVDDYEQAELRTFDVEDEETAALNPSGNPSRKGSTNPSRKVSRTTTTTTNNYNNNKTHAQICDSSERETSGYPEAFETFWAAYPKRTGKLRALKRWREAKKRVSEDRLLEQARAYARHVDAVGLESRFIKNAEGWLSEGRYDDDFDELTAQRLRPATTTASNGASWWGGEFLAATGTDNGFIDAEIVQQELT